MENTTPKKMKDDACCNTNDCAMTGECPCCATMKNCCMVCKIAQCIFRGLVILALAKFVFCGIGGGYNMRGGMGYNMDRGSMMMSGSLKDYKGERGFFKKGFDRDDTTVGTGLIATESTQ